MRKTNENIDQWAKRFLQLNNFDSKCADPKRQTSHAGHINRFIASERWSKDGASPWLLDFHVLK